MAALSQNFVFNLLETMNKEITLTDSQQHILDHLLAFVDSPEQRVFILNGYAGTGKTTLMRFFVEQLNDRKRPFQLLAPTGRAAKILSNLSGSGAETIHSMIYTFSSLNKDLSSFDNKDLTMEKTGQLFLNFTPATLDEETTEPTVYIVDESSMVSDFEQKNITQASFGSGKLLTELLNYDKRPQSKFVFIGDPCQLPPVDGTFSPALMTLYFSKCYGLEAEEHSLTEILRQSDDSDLITTSHLIRQRYATAPEYESWYGGQNLWGRIPLRNCKELVLHASLDDMVASYIEHIKQNGYNDAIFIAQSNNKSHQLSLTIRRKLGFGPTLQKGDLLMVVQNNYPTGLMNGDMVEVLGVGSRRIRMADLDFVTVSVRELFSNARYETLLLESMLYSDLINLSSEQQTRLFLNFIMRCKDKKIDMNKDRDSFNKALRTDPFLNALRCSFGYAITCHKAQGGEWNQVYIDFGNMALRPTKGKYQWIYTAITRARQKIHSLDKPYISY